MTVRWVDTKEVVAMAPHRTPKGGVKLVPIRRLKLVDTGRNYRGPRVKESASLLDFLMGR